MLHLVHRLLLIEDLSSNNNSKDLDKLTAQKRLFDWLESIGVKNPYIPKGQDSKPSDPDYKIRKNLTGDDCLKIAKNFNKDVIPNNKDNVIIAQIFNDYYRIHMNYVNNFYESKPDLLRQRTSEWKKLFLSVFHTKHVTSYIHYFTDHLASDIEQYGDVDIFNIEG